MHTLHTTHKYKDNHLISKIFGSNISVYTCHVEHSRDIFILSFWAKSIFLYSVISIKVEMSGFCHSERSEESVCSISMAVCYLLLHLSMSWPGRFMVFSARTQHESIHIEWFHVVTGRFLTHFLLDTTPQTAYGDPSLCSGWQNEVQDDRGTVQDDRVMDGAGWQRA